jgi:hypothetical protein
MPARFTTISGLLALAVGVSPSLASAQQVKTVFVIAMENTNWAQTARQFTGSQQQIFQNPAAPWLNQLVNGNLIVNVAGVPTNISAQTSFSTHDHNVGSNPAGTGLHIHPSEPNYIWSEGGTNFGVLNDNQPYGNGGTNQNTSAHLATLLTNAGKTWRSYQEDIDLVATSGQFVNAPGANSLTSVVAPQGTWTVPLLNFSGTGPQYLNPYNGTHQYDYAAKHNPMVFFTDTNGGNNQSPSNPQRLQYAPLQQLAFDLSAGTVANYNFITPNQFNDMHTALATSFTYQGVTYLNNSNTSGAEKVAQGDNFLSQIVPLIMASTAYQDNGAIILWWDESEPDGTTNQDDFSHTIPEIVISPLAHPNVNGVPYASVVDLTHSSDLRSMQKIFGVDDAFLGDAATAPDLADLFAPGALNGPLSLAGTAFVRDRRSGHYFQQVTITNTGATALAGPFYYILDNLSSNATLLNATSVTNNPPAGSVYLVVPDAANGLASGASASVVLEVANPSNTGITYVPRLLHGNVNP